MTKDRCNQDFESILMSLWLNWALSSGAIYLPMLISLMIPMPWIPIASLVLMILTIVYSRTSFSSSSGTCFMITAIATRTLLISVIIMEVILFLTANGYLHRFFDMDAMNEKIPFIPILVIAPVALLVSLYYKIRGHHNSVCHRCSVKFGTIIERGFIGKTLAEESSYQLNFMVLMTAVSTVVSTIYYFFFYINVNINSSDGFFFAWLPFLWYVIITIFMATRYLSLWGYYAQDVEGSSRRAGDKTWMRYLIISDNFIYLSRSVEFYDRPGMDKIDTPATLNVPYTGKPAMSYARQVYTDISNLPEDKYDLRFMYVSTEAEGMSNIYHYIVTLKDKEIIAGSSLSGKWYSISELQRLIYNRDISPILAAEINRLYTVAMAWKTYDRDGNRLYKVKNYRPMFRFSGIGDWDVDFNDPHWLRVARFNQDKPFFRIRRWFKRLAGEY